MTENPYKSPSDAEQSQATRKTASKFWERYEGWIGLAGLVGAVVYLLVKIYWR